MTPLTDQQREFRSLTHAGENVIADAPPGCGKTTTEVATFLSMTALMQRDTNFLVYNAHSKDDVKKRLPPGDADKVKTVDSIAWNAVARQYSKRFGEWRLDSWKYRRMIEHFARDFHASNQFTPEQLQAFGDLDKLRSITQAQLLDPQDWVRLRKLLDRYGIVCENTEQEDFLRQGLPAILDWTRKGNKSMSRSPHFLSTFDFQELPWLVEMENIQPAPLRIALADEIQDLTVAQWSVVKRALGKDGQFAGCGDPNQALYQFRGVLGDQFGRIVKDTNAKLVKLTVSFRCPHVAIPTLKEYIPDIEAHPSNPEGAIIEVTRQDCLSVLKPGDVCLFLTNDQAIGMTYFLLRKGIPATVKGQDIAEDLLALLDLLEAKEGFTFYDPDPDVPHLTDFVDEWEQKRLSAVRVLHRDSESAEDAITQRAESVRVLFSEAVADGIADIADFRVKVRSLFSADKDVSIYDKYVVSMTIHKSKGLEWDNVLVSHDDMVSFRGKTEEARQQHRNCLLVAKSRYRKIRYTLKQPKETYTDVF